VIEYEVFEVLKWGNDCIHLILSIRRLIRGLSVWIPISFSNIVAQTDQSVDSKSKRALKEDERPFFCDGECGHSLKAASDS
jgi:hypothetical protein